MRIECPECGRVAEAQDIRSDRDRMSWTCGACGRRVSAPVPRAPAAEKEPHDHEPSDVATSQAGQRCPKCGAPRTDRPDCPHCGLVYEKWSEDRLDVPEVLVRSWQTVLENYQEEGVHDSFVDTARQMARLDVAAMYYRRRLVADPEDEVARRRLEVIVRIVEAEALRRSPQPVRRSRLVRNTLWGVVVASLLFLLYLLLTSHPARPPRPGAAATAPGEPPPDATAGPLNPSPP